MVRIIDTGDLEIPFHGSGVDGHSYVFHDDEDRKERRKRSKKKKVVDPPAPPAEKFDQGKELL